jgi:hypothetical protein
MAAVVEAQEGASGLLGPGIQRRYLGGAHVGFEPAEPHHLRSLALAGEHGDPAGIGALADRDGLGHG